MMSWPATIALTLVFSFVVALLVASFELSSVFAFILCVVGVFLVKVVSKRPEFDGLPAPPPK
jgi:hypothetical protein